MTSAPMLNLGVEEEEDGGGGSVAATVPHTSWAGMGERRARIAVHVSSSAVMADA